MKSLLVLFMAAILAATACNDNARSRNAEDSTKTVAPADTGMNRTDTSHMDTTMHR